MILVSLRGLEVSNIVLIDFKNSPTYTQRFIDRRLYKFRYFYQAYIDDIIIFSRTVKEYVRYVSAILKLFEKSKLRD